MYDFFPTTPGLARMRREMANEASEFLRELRADSKSRRLCNSKLKMISEDNDKSLVDWRLYREHNDKTLFENLYGDTKVIGPIKAKLLECFGYRILRRAG